MTGVELIAAERQRQIEKEGWTPEHDDGHCCEEMARAAACYALPSKFRMALIFHRRLLNILWPWDDDWWKPCSPKEGGRMRELVKAGALIAAEIDRLQREKTASLSSGKLTT